MTNVMLLQQKDVLFKIIDEIHRTY